MLSRLAEREPLLEREEQERRSVPKGGASGEESVMVLSEPELKDLRLLKRILRGWAFTAAAGDFFLRDLALVFLSAAVVSNSARPPSTHLSFCLSFCLSFSLSLLLCKLPKLPPRLRVAVPCPFSWT